MEGAAHIPIVPARWRILSDAAVVGAFLAVAKAAGAIKVVLIARTFGATDIVDAFLIAFLLPAFFADVVAGPLGAALIPTLIEVRESDGILAARKLHGNLTAGMFGLMCALALLLALLAPVITPLLASAFPPDKLRLTQNTFYWLLPLLPLCALGVSWRAALNASERFAIPAMGVAATPMILALLLIAVGSQWGIRLLIGGTLAGNMVELFLLGTALRRCGYRLLPRWTGGDPMVRRVFRQQVPLIATAALGQAGILVDQSVAASLGAGSVAALNYGTRLVAVIAGIGVSALGTAALPHLSRMITAARWQQVKRTLLTYGSLIVIGGLTLCIAMVTYSDKLVEFVFGGRALTASSTELVASVQRISLLQLPALALIGLLGRFITSLRANDVLALAAALSLVVNVVGDLVLPRYIGLPGIALSGVAAQLVSLSCILFFVVRRMMRVGS
jgi:putative peptidoglycan lipid II flippase